MKKNKGITLIALVITIIVLLILAGVTIASLSGDNGILTRASQAKIESEISGLEEEANLIYINLLMDNNIDGGAKPTLDDVVAKLPAEKIIKKNSSSNAGGDLVFNPEIKAMNYNSTTEINVSTNSSEGFSYYAVINGKNYEMKLANKAGINISRTETKFSGNETPAELKITKNTNTGLLEATIEGGKIKLTSKAQPAQEVNEVTLTVIYGTITKELTIILKPIKVATKFGSIDIQWVDTNNKIITTPNIPNKKPGMEELKFNQDTEWYDYSKQKWANVRMTSDDSEFVWIPRYAYKITYYTDSNKNVIAGYSDATGIHDGNGNYEHVWTDVTSVGDNYIVHPAFVKNVNNGGWLSELSGIWVAKYEMSMEKKQDLGNDWVHVDTNNTTADNPNNGNLALDNMDTVRMVSKKGTSSWRYITAQNIYNNCKKYNNTINSHMMKNSEWGAVAYLAHSKYGLKGNEVKINSSGYISGNVAEASSTGNAYGIYDLSGAAWEYVAASIGNRFEEAKSNEYFTNYTNPANSNTNYSGAIVGDATLETAGWFGEYAYFPTSATSAYPVFARGGVYNYEAIAGLFCFGASSGSVYTHHSFRVCLSF